MNGNTPNNPADVKLDNCEHLCRERSKPRRTLETASIPGPFRFSRRAIFLYFLTLLRGIIRSYDRWQAARPE